MATYGPEEFTALLSRNQLPDPVNFGVAGMIKVNEELPSMVSFTLYRNCERWISLPVSMVATFTHMANVTCKDHEHPVVKIRFKKPEGTQQEAQFLLDLCSQLQSLLTRAHRAKRALQSSTENSGDNAREDCYVVDVGGSLEICCWDDDGVLDCGGIV